VDVAGFNPSPAPAFYWVRFTLDEVYIHYCDFLYFSGTSLVRRLALVVDGRDSFLDRRHSMGAIISKSTALRKLTIIDCDGDEADSWYTGWSNFMESRYYRCDPVPYHTTIVCDDLVLTPENMLEFDRRLYKWERRFDMEENPGLYESDNVPSDDDADPRDSPSMANRPEYQA